MFWVHFRGILPRSRGIGDGSVNFKRFSNIQKSAVSFKGGLIGNYNHCEKRQRVFEGDLVTVQKVLNVLGNLQGISRVFQRVLVSFRESLGVFEALMSFQRCFRSFMAVSGGSR